MVTKPAKAVIVSASKVAAGMDFTLWLCNGRIFSAGNPQFGQLGHGTDHEYNASDCECRATPSCKNMLLAIYPSVRVRVASYFKLNATCVWLSSVCEDRL